MSDPQLLFLAGLGRSGTSALTEVVGAHPEIVLGMERFKRRWKAKIGELDAGHFTKERFFDFSDGLTNVVPAGSPRWTEFYGRMEAKWDQAKYVGDKFTTLQMPGVWKNMPDAKFICIVRDIREVASSWEKRAANQADKGWPARLDAHRAVEVWNNGNARILRATENHPDQVRVLDYATFFGAADAGPLRRALDWLGLDWTPEVEAEFGAAHQKYVGSIANKDRKLPRDMQKFIRRNTDQKRYERLLTRVL